MASSDHISVMTTEVLEHLAVQASAWYIDATFGAGGHTLAILEQQARVIALDWDAANIAQGKQKFESQVKTGQLILCQANFAQLETVVKQQTCLEDKVIAGVLFDLGTATSQLMSSQRGFSVIGSGPLDMRMDPENQAVTAADLLAAGSEKELTHLFRNLGGEHEAKAIAKRIKHNPTPITTTDQLSQLIMSTKREITRLHPATKVFQALRIAVNSELDNLNQALPQALAALSQQGRVVTIAFHDGEDRIVKQTFQRWQIQGKGEVVTRKPIVASAKELAANPRSRSAKMRVFIKSSANVLKA